MRPDCHSNESVWPPVPLLVAVVELAILEWVTPHGRKPSLLWTAAHWLALVLLVVSVLAITSRALRAQLSLHHRPQEVRHR